MQACSPNSSRPLRFCCSLSVFLRHLTFYFVFQKHKNYLCLRMFTLAFNSAWKTRFPHLTLFAISLSAQMPHNTPFFTSQQKNACLLSLSQQLALLTYSTNHHLKSPCPFVTFVLFYSLCGWRNRSVWNSTIIQHKARTWHIINTQDRNGKWMANWFFKLVCPLMFLILATKLWWWNMPTSTLT